MTDVPTSDLPERASDWSHETTRGYRLAVQGNYRYVLGGRLGHCHSAARKWRDLLADVPCAADSKQSGSQIANIASLHRRPPIQ